MPTFRQLRYEKPPLPAGFEGDPRTPPAYVEEFLPSFTEPGDVVLDPFAGFGTTLRVATALGREAVGIEYDPERAAHAREHAPDATVYDGDARTVSVAELPAADCVFTSPPYMARQDDRNPFENYDGESDYEAYLTELRQIFARLRPTLQAGAPVLVDVANMKYRDTVTTLAWDVADVLARPFHFDGEIVVTWTGDPGADGTYGYGYDHSYLLVFEHRKRDAAGNA